jgi:hypothetical protein
MHHTSARAAITSLLANKGFGERGLALVLAAACGDADKQAVALRQAALARADAMTGETNTSYTGELLIAPIPADEDALCRQLCPVIISSAKDVGLQTACLSALVALWPHVSTAERGLMRQRFLDGLMSDRLAPEAKLSSEQLIAWQRDLPTSQSEPHASVATLKGLLGETTAKGAYRVMADHLGMNANLPTLSWVLGTLAVQVRLRFHDPDGLLLHVLLGTVACERLAAFAQPEHLATLITQVGHQLWWCVHQAGLSPVRTCIDPSTQDFAEAVASGNLTAAQRAARALAKNPAAFWERAWKLVEERIAANDPHWYIALELVLVSAWRTSTDVVSPDDAAAVGTVLADLAYRDKRTPALAGH